MSMGLKDDQGLSQVNKLPTISQFQTYMPGSCPNPSLRASKSVGIRWNFTGKVRERLTCRLAGLAAVGAGWRTIALLVAEATGGCVAAKSVWRMEVGSCGHLKVSPLSATDPPGLVLPKIMEWRPGTKA